MTGRSARALCDGADVAREAIGNSFCVRICYMFLISVLVLRYFRLENECATAKSEKRTCFNAGKIGFCHCTSGLKAQVPKQCTDLDLSLLYILILGTLSKFERKIDFLALSVYCPAGQSAFCRSCPQLKLGEEIKSSRLVDD